ncbi:hypothetical protein H4582DRAFT_2053182 [Lactarius indigo]|nr:hypothetical protein H4582DRAFT_2053182 [Lactarius indigo]
MAKLIRSAKSASDWTRNELAAYNITVEYHDAATFFCMHNLPQPAIIDPTVLTATGPGDAAGTSNGVAILLDYMDSLCLLPHQRSLLSTILLWVILTSEDTPLVICGENRNAKVNVCVFDVFQKGILHHVLESKRYMDHSDPEPQLVAKAIAAFPANNRTRQQKLNQPPLVSKIMDGITMMGTAPIFYKIKITCPSRGLPSDGNHCLRARSRYPEIESSLKRRNAAIG